MLVLISTLSLAAAAVDLVSSVHILRNDVNSMEAMVSSFNSQSGLQYALSIQSDFNPLSSAAHDLNDAFHNVNRLSDELTRNVVDALYPLSSSLSRLLAQLTLKAQDFDALSVKNIVSNDLQSLAPVVRSIELRAFDVVPSNEPTAVYGSISDIAHTISTAFHKVETVYHIDLPNMPQAPDFGGGGSSNNKNTGRSRMSKNRGST